MTILLLLFFGAVLLLGVCIALVIRKAGDTYASRVSIGPAAEAPKRVQRPGVRRQKELDPWEGPPINPATGLPMLGDIAGHDVGGNTFGNMDSFFRRK